MRDQNSYLNFEFQPTYLEVSYLNVTLQMKLEKSGGIQDLSVEQVLGLTEGKEISEKELMKKIR